MKDDKDSRRDFLKRALRTGAYVAPVMVAMSMKTLSAQQPSSPGMSAGMGNMNGAGNMP